MLFDLLLFHIELTIKFFITGRENYFFWHKQLIYPEK